VPFAESGFQFSRAFAPPATNGFSISVLIEPTNEQKPVGFRQISSEKKKYHFEQFEGSIIFL
jgi:hypothetical protein